MATTNLEDPQKKESTKEQADNQTNMFQAQEKFNSLQDFATSHTYETVAYIVMFVGIITSIFTIFWGGALIGIITGIYFSQEIIQICKSYQDFLSGENFFKALVFGGACLGLFIANPMFFIGAAVALGLKTLILGAVGSNKKEKTDPVQK